MKSKSGVQSTASQKAFKVEKRPARARKRAAAAVPVVRSLSFSTDGEIEQYRSRMKRRIIRDDDESDHESDEMVFIIF